MFCKKPPKCPKRFYFPFSSNLQIKWRQFLRTDGNDRKWTPINLFIKYHGGEHRRICNFQTYHWYVSHGCTGDFLRHSGGTSWPWPVVPRPLRSKEVQCIRRHGMLSIVAIGPGLPARCAKTANLRQWLLSWDIPIPHVGNIKIYTLLEDDFDSQVWNEGLKGIQSLSHLAWWGPTSRWMFKDYS